MPVPVLALTYWLHLLATVVWLGGLAMLALASWSSLAVSPDVSGSPILDALEKRFRPWANLSLIVLLVSGTIQMGADSHYEGFLVVASAWTLGLLAKHLVIGGMIVISVFMQLSLYPALERARLLSGRGSSEDIQTEVSLRRRVKRLTVLNLGLGVLVLLLTGLITAL